MEIVARFRARDAEKFGINVRVGNGEKTVIGYDVDRGGVYVDRTKSGEVGFSASFPSTEFAPLKLRARGTVKLRILVDRSSVEVFADNGRVDHHRPDLPEPARTRSSSSPPVVARN